MEIACKTAEETYYKSFKKPISLRTLVRFLKDNRIKITTIGTNYCTKSYYDYNELKRKHQNILNGLEKKPYLWDKNLLKRLESFKNNKGAYIAGVESHIGWAGFSAQDHSVVDKMMLTISKSKKQQ